MLQRLHRKASLLVLFAERVQVAIPSFVSFAVVGCISDVVVLEVNWKRIAILNVRHLQIIMQE